MQSSTRIRVYKGLEVEVITYGQPDPAVAAKAILPLILEMWAKQQRDIKTDTHAAHE